jgi:ABC-type transport system substrate-binding protein
MTSDIVNDNFWAFYGPDGTVYMSYVHGPTKPSLFTVEYPGLVIGPDVAVGLPVAAVQEGDIWTVTQPIRDDYVWSDGSALTASDVVFTYEAIRDAELGGDWIAAYPYTEESSPRLTSVEAVDATTVKFTFDAKPGGAVWPNNVGVAPIMPAVAWEPVLAEAVASEDPAAVVYGANSLEIGDLSGGPVSYNGREEGAFVENVKNENYSNAGL